MLVLQNPGHVRYGKTRACAVLLVTGADIAYTAHHALRRGNAAPRIGVTAHCVGAVGGLLLGLALYRGSRPCPPCAGLPQPWPTYRTRRALKIASSVLLSVATVFSVAWIFITRHGAAH